jgi:hypothetical protein
MRHRFLIDTLWSRYDRLLSPVRVEVLWIDCWNLARTALKSHHQRHRQYNQSTNRNDVKQESVYEN